MALLFCAGKKPLCRVSNEANMDLDSDQSNQNHPECNSKMSRSFGSIVDLGLNSGPAPNSPCDLENLM